MDWGIVFSLFIGHYWPSKKYDNVGVGRSCSSNF